MISPYVYLDVEKLLLLAGVCCLGLEFQYYRENDDVCMVIMQY